MGHVFDAMTMAQGLKELVYPWRWTDMGAWTKVYAYCRVCGPLTPTSFRRSKRETHGEDIYLHSADHVVEYCVLEESNTGKKSFHHSEGFPADVAQQLYLSFVKDGSPPSHEEYLRFFSKASEG